MKTDSGKAWGMQWEIEGTEGGGVTCRELLVSSFNSVPVPAAPHCNLALPCLIHFEYNLFLLYTCISGSSKNQQ